MCHCILINFYLFFLQKCNFDHSELPKNSVLERIWNMQRLSYVNTNYIYNVYSNFTSLLNDDMIYSDLIKLNKTRNVFHASLGNPMVGVFSYTKEGIFIEYMNAYLFLFQNAIQKIEIIKEIDFQTFLKSTIVQKHDDLNRNCSASSECVLSTNTGRVLRNGDPVSQIEISSNLDSHQPFHGNKSLHNQRTSNDDERKANVQITAEHLSALQNCETMIRIFTAVIFKATRIV